MTRLFSLICVGCSLGSLAPGQIRNVVVTGTTPTQAILAYDTPTSAPCKIEVSESSSLSPLVHDVDPRLFRDADFDNRPGNANRGDRRTFVIGKRAAEVTL